MTALQAAWKALTGTLAVGGIVVWLGVFVAQYDKRGGWWVLFAMVLPTLFVALFVGGLLVERDKRRQQTRTAEFDRVPPL